jgi:hypothetical protein
MTANLNRFLKWRLVTRLLIALAKSRRRPITRRLVKMGALGGQESRFLDVPDEFANGIPCDSRPVENLVASLRAICFNRFSPTWVARRTGWGCFSGLSDR